MARDNQHATNGPHIGPLLCVSFCESASPRATYGELYETLVATCYEAGFPHCGRLYAGSYFCENYFCALTDGFHEALRALCREYDLGATLVVPIIGQAFLDRAEGRLFDVLDRFGDVYDEVIVNDVAEFLYLNDVLAPMGKRLGLGRLFSKEPRDARYADMAGRVATPTLSAEALECLGAARSRTKGAHEAGLPGQAPQSGQSGQSGQLAPPLIDLDPVSAVVDASEVLREAPGAEVAVHLPLCFATTGRNCSHASIDEPDLQKFRLGQGCSQHCLRMVQGCRTHEGATYVKHGRTYYFANPTCQIAGAERWRIVYSAAHETMRDSLMFAMSGAAGIAR